MYKLSSILNTGS